MVEFQSTAVTCGPDPLRTRPALGRRVPAPSPGLSSMRRVIGRQSRLFGERSIYSGKR